MTTPRATNRTRLRRLALLALAGASVHASLAGCATRSSNSGYQHPQAVARITRDELEPLRHPVESSTAYVERAADRLSARPSNYGAIGEQSAEGVEQIGHWWDAVLGRPARSTLGKSPSRY